MSDQRDNPPNVLSFAEAKRKRDIEEERRLERLVIERWTGKGEDAGLEEK